MFPVPTMPVTARAYDAIACDGDTPDITSFMATVISCEIRGYIGRSGRYCATVRRLVKNALRGTLA